MGLIELVIIAVAALVLLGPQKLPEVLQQLGKLYVQFRRTSNEFRSAFDHVVRQAEEETRVEEIKRLTNLANEQAAALKASMTEHLLSSPVPTPPSATAEVADSPIARSSVAAASFDSPAPNSPETPSQEPVLPPKPDGTTVP